MKKIWEKIKELASKFWSWVKTSNHWKHLACCLAGTFFFGYGFGIGAGLAAEYKDVAWGGEWSWADILADIIGTVAGTFLRHIIFGLW
jgi:hypothetical protein